ncbi:MAG TPA: hypothetical protein VHO95_13215, partial [Candidatus Dormibacteraeota bacterium]|nr:hypothetical protein [Candidatus Dormibacteraeota bacterium]
MDVQESRSSQWLAIWIAGATSTLMGVGLLYVGPLPFPIEKLLPAEAPLVLIGAGAIGVVLGSIRLVWARWRSATAHRGADIAAFAGAFTAGAALLVVLLIQVAWPAVDSAMRPGPCDSNPMVACFQAHPDYYQPIGPDGYSTPASRLGQTVTSVELSMWPIALAAAFLCLIALALGTRRQRIAALGLAMGSVVVAGMVIEYLAFLV